MKKTIPLLFLFAGNILLFGQNPEEEDAPFYNREDSLLAEEDTFSEVVILDNAEEAVNDTFSLKNISFAIEFSDSFYASKLASIASDIPLTYNRQVKNFIELYANKRRKSVERILGLKEIYFPMFEEIFAQYDVPPSMKYLAVIESALNPVAVSHAGAVGMWQFIRSTGKQYDLSVDPYIDERRDPYKATEAAARHLRDLFEYYNDWSLALAAYNCGSHNVDKAIRRSGGLTDYWQIIQYLPRETRGYVPGFIAAAYIMNFSEYHGFVPQPPVICYDSVCAVLIERPAHFHSLSKHLGLALDDLMHLNPELKRGFVPKSATPYWLNLPESKTLVFEQYQDTIFSESEKIQETQFPQLYDLNLKNRLELIYTVKSGDNLGFIADWYDCRVQDLRIWNDIYRSRIKPGQKLRVYVPKEKAERYKKIDKMSFVQKQKLLSKTNQQLSAKTNVKNPTSDGKYLYHTIKDGDTLWDIAKLYPGVSVEQLKKINSIDNSKRLKPGMLIKVQAVG